MLCAEDRTAQFIVQLSPCNGNNLYAVLRIANCKNNKNASTVNNLHTVRLFSLFADKELRAQWPSLIGKIIRERHPIKRIQYIKMHIRFCFLVVLFNTDRKQTSKQVAGIFLFEH